MGTLRFPEKIGTTSNDQLTSGSQTLTFGLSGNDELYALDNSQNNWLAGGMGDDQYYLAQGAKIGVVDTGGVDTLFAPRLGLTDPNTYFFTSYNSLAAYTDKYGDTITIFNWREPTNSIEYFQLQDGRFTLLEVIAAVEKSPNYRGDLSWEELELGTIIPKGTTLAQAQEFINYIKAREDSLQAKTSTLDVIIDLFGQVLYLKGLKETITSTSHTVEYAGTTFKWSEVDSFVTTVTRDGNFTDEFAKEIADAYPSVAGISYSTAVALVGASAIDSVLIAVAGADGNYVG